jgi:hypothetical protein
LHHETWIGRLALIVLILVASIAGAAPIEPGHVVVIDGDTIRVAGETFRLVGFDTPETYRARCPAERELGHRATFRLHQLVAGGGLDLERVRCACRPGTEGAALQSRPLMRRAEDPWTGCWGRVHAAR